MFANFTAHGMVREIKPESTQSGLNGTTLVLKVGEWQGQQGTQEELLKVTLWGDKAQMAHGVNVGDSVAVSGRVSSKLNQRGYWNDRLQVMTLVVVARGQNAQQPTQQPAQQDPYANADSPF